MPNRATSSQLPVDIPKETPIEIPDEPQEKATPIEDKKADRKPDEQPATTDEVVSSSSTDNEKSLASEDHAQNESSSPQSELAKNNLKPRPSSGISLLDSALSIARDTAGDETETGTKRFDRRLTQAIKEAEIYNQPGTYSANQITSYTDHIGRQFVKVGNKGCFELVDGEIGLQEGKVWYFSDECPGQQDKPAISFEHIN